MGHDLQVCAFNSSAKEAIFYHDAQLIMWWLYWVAAIPHDQHELTLGNS